MKIQEKSLIICTLAAILPALTPLSSLAQNINTGNDGTQSNEYDPAMGNVGGTSLNPTQLIHDYNLRRDKSPEEFNSEAQETLTQSADDFRRQQQQKYQANPSAPPNTTNLSKP